MLDTDNIKFSRGFGYKAQDVDDCIDRLLDEKAQLKHQIDVLRKEAQSLRVQRDELEKKLLNASSSINVNNDTRRTEVTDLETKQVRDFADLMDNGKKIVTQMVNEAKQQAAEILGNAKQVMENAERESEEIKSRAFNDIKGVSALLAEIAKASSQSKEHVTALYDEIEMHYQDFVDEIKMRTGDILSAEND